MDECASAPPPSDGSTATTSATPATPTPRPERDLLPWTIAGHRATVVRRLLDRGLTARTLATVLPEWAGTIDEVARGHRTTIA